MMDITGLLQNDKSLIVKFKDHYGDFCLSDSVAGISDGVSYRRNPIGFVEIYEATPKNVKLLGKHNLVVYLGREWLAVRAFNVANGNITPTKDEFITWFGLGTGGVLPGDPFDPVPPTNTDTDLDTEIGINATDATCADFHDGMYYKHPFDSVTYEQDSENSNSWLLGRVVTTIGSDDANGNNLSEAGLFTAESSSGGYAGPFHLFSKVTFPTIVKNSSRQLIFVWYLYF